MLLKRSALITAFVALCSLFSAASVPDSLWVQREVQQLKKENQRLERTVDRLSRQVNYLSQRVGAVERSAADSVASVGERVAGVQTELAKSQSGLSSRIDDIDEKVVTGTAASDRRSHHALLWAIIGTVCLAAAIAAAYLLLRRKVSGSDSRLDSLASEAEESRRRQVELDSRLTEVIERQLSQVKADTGEDHSLALMIANEMARIEQNLQFMDPATKGVRQLRNRSKAILDGLKGKGYEIPSLVGTEYKEGYNMEASVEEDETVPPGKMIVKRVTRPAVLFRGKMIQAAQVVVGYNPDGE